MDCAQALAFVQQLVFETTGVPLDALTEELFPLAWADATYETIARQLGYEESYIRDRGSRLFKILREALHEPIGKQNFQQILTRRWAQQPAASLQPTAPLQPAESPLTSQQVEQQRQESHTNFLGREPDLAMLHRLVQDNAIVLIQGAGGLGKTTLARKYFEKHSFRVLSIWMATADQRLITPAEIIVEEWLRGEFDQPAGRDFGINLERLRRCLRDSTQPIGVLIDNFDSALDGHGHLIESRRCYLELLRLLADPSLSVVTLITSREGLQESGVTPIVHRLEGLSETTWAEYFQHHQITTTPATVREIRTACGGSAKAMQILKGTAQADFEGDLEAYWQACDRNLLINGVLQDLVCSQFDAIQRTNPAAYQLLCRLGAYRYQDVPFVSLQGVKCLLWDLPESQRQEVIQDLRGRSLIEVRRNQKFWLHPIIQTEAIQRLRRSPDWETTHRQAAQFWLTHVTRIETVDDALQVLQAYHHYLEIEDYEQAGEVIVTPKPNRWNSQTEVGWLFYRLSLLQQMTAAIIHIIDHIPIDERTGRLRNLLGYMHRLSGEMDSAIVNHRTALEIAETLASQPLQISSLFNLGLCHRDLWQINAAIDYFQQVQQRAAPLGLKEYTIYANGCLAYLYSQQGKSQLAIAYANRISPWMLQEQVSAWGAGCTWLYLADTYRNLGELEAATELYQDTLLYAQANQFIHIVANALSGMAQVDRTQQQYPQAIGRHDTAIDYLQQINAKCDLAEAYLQRGLTYQCMGVGTHSRQDFHQAHRLFRSVQSLHRLTWLETQFDDDLY